MKGFLLLILRLVEINLTSGYSSLDFREAYQPSVELHRTSGSGVLQVQSNAQEVSFSEHFVREESLLSLIRVLVAKELANCSLVIAREKDFSTSLFNKIVRLLPNTRQIVELSAASDFYNIVWKSPKCRGYIFLQRRHDILNTFADYDDYIWDFSGRYIVIGLNKAELQSLSTTRKVHKTENFIGVIKGQGTGEWLLYTNQIVSSMGITLMTSWKHNRFTAEDSEIYPDKLADFKGAPIKIGTFQYRPSVMFQKDDEGNVLDRYGRDVMVAEALVEAFNAKLIYKNIPQNEVWGQLYDNGTWTGLMGALQKGQVDIGVANIYITNVTFRMLVADFSAPFDIEVSGFLSRKPKPLPEWERIVYPFQLQTWLAIFVGLVASGPLLMSLAKLGHLSGGESQDIQGLSFAYLYTAGIHFMEGQAITPRRRGIQIFISFLWMYSIIITTGYNSNLTAMLTVSRQPPTIDTIKALFESDLRLAASGNLFKVSLLKSTNRYLNALAERYDEYNGKPEKLKSLVEEGHTMILAGQNVLNYMVTIHFTSGEFSSARIIKETFSPFNVGVALQRGSPLKRRVDVFIQRMVEAGLIRYWFKASLRRAKKESEEERQRHQREIKGITEENRGGGEEEEEVSKVMMAGAENQGVRALGFAHMQGFFFILFVGYLASVILFALELVLLSLL